MFNRRLVLRELAGPIHQSVIFILCVALSMVTLVSLSGFSESVDRSLLKDARTLHAADIIIESNYAPSKPLLDSIASLKRKGATEQANIYEFYSVVRSVENEGSLLADLKVVEAGYPFYGKVELASGDIFQHQLTKGNIVVEQGLLERLRVKVGDSIHIGNATLTIRDVVLKEPDRPVNFFSLGPRIFITGTDLNELGLVQKGSRVLYKILLKVNDEAAIDRIVRDLRAVAIRDQERIETFKTAESGIKRFFDNFLFFLSLIGIFTLLLAGIGIQSALTAFLREREKTIAIMKVMGARRRFITIHFTTIVSVLGLIGTFIGLSLSYLLQSTFPIIFGALIPGNVELSISWIPVVQGLILGSAVVALFTFLPLYRLEDVKPASILGKEGMRGKRGMPYYVSIAATIFFSAAMVVWQVRDIRTGLYFIMGVLALIIISAFAAELVMIFLKKQHVRSLTIRLALRGLLRPGNATRPIIITLTATLTVVSSIYLIEQNLDADFVRYYPEDAPNLFFLDIQPSQREEFSRVLGMKSEFYPVVRARIASINGEPVNIDKEQRRMRDNLAREFNLTYRNYLLPDESIIRGKDLYREDWQEAQVSVLDTVLKMRDMKIGDVIKFNIQGVPLEAKISSIRTRTRSRAAIQPFFYFVFPEKTLKEAPQTIFTAVRVNKKEIPMLQNRIVSGFQNISVIDMTEVVSLFSRVIGRLSAIARFFTSFSIIAGVLIIISSAFATRYARVRESVYFKILGAKGSFVLKVLTLENLLLGLISSILAVVLSETISWIVCSKVLEITHTMFVRPGLLMILSTLLLVIFTGMLASISVLRQRPVIFLREETME